ncbi:MAG TPA: FG-GAP-like repeat-containing protein, partial [Rhodanobacteraceae bacterium]|nr:FG-GAP-like repeat-containing protein [Rhodanobacteraceae bacterium]
MRMSARCTLFRFSLALALAGLPLSLPAISVSATSPAGNAISVARNAGITIDFDRRVATASITPSSLRIWGQQSGRLAGAIAYSNGDSRLTFTPSGTYFPGEWITVQLAHSITGADASPLRAAGYVFQFVARTAPASMSFTQNGPPVSVRTDDSVTRLYGGAITDLDNDGWVDFIAINEISADLRVLLNSANGSGLLQPVMQPTTPIGVEASPSVVADFDYDGNMDVATGNSTSYTASIALGSGDGQFRSVQNVDVGARPHGIVALDVDGDGKLDVAQANGYDNNGAILRGNGDGTLQAAELYPIGGSAVGSSLGDIDGDGDLDWVISSYGASEWYVLENDGSGGFDRVDVIPAPSNASCASLYDFDNNGTLDMALADEVSDEILLEKNDGATSVLHADVAVALSGD